MISLSATASQMEFVAGGRRVTVPCPITAIRRAWKACTDLGVDVSAPIEGCLKALIDVAYHHDMQLRRVQYEIAELRSELQNHLRNRGT